MLEFAQQTGAIWQRDGSVMRSWRRIGSTRLARCSVKRTNLGFGGTFVAGSVACRRLPV
ncbi:hypothetical protein [Rhizobium mayense]|uniref:hypothetical protein n=1 Tax=Rhizobium mayense TaxID=1312184 RepID=UPI00398C2D73